jgi:hypothetical protein
MTLHEIWNSNKPSLTHLKAFGCDAYVHVPKKNRSKMDKKVEKCIFIGYKDGMKGYNICNLETKKEVYRQDVAFIEIKDVFKQEVIPREEEQKKIDFELKDNESGSREE